MTAIYRKLRIETWMWGGTTAHHDGVKERRGMYMGVAWILQFSHQLTSGRAIPISAPYPATAARRAVSHSAERDGPGWLPGVARLGFRDWAHNAEGLGERGDGIGESGRVWC